MIQTIQAQTGHSLRRLCEALTVPRSSHYHAAQPTPGQRADEELGAHIETILRAHRRRYGYRRIWKDLEAAGHPCAPDRVRRLMRARRLHAIAPRTYVPRTSDGRADAPSPNLLAGQPLPQKPNEARAGDITFIPVSGGWLYLAVVIDLCARRILGWALADHLRADLVTDALRAALASRRDTRGAILLRAAPRRSPLRGSLSAGGLAPRGSTATAAAASSAACSRRTDCARACPPEPIPYHHAWSESCIGRFKAELLQGGSFSGPDDARTELFASIEGYYNTHRRHSSLNYLSPTSFEASLTNKN